jgi:hypothetical protein
MRKDLTIVAALILVFLSVQAAQAATIVVPNDQPTIQDAVDAANPGDTVKVKFGKGGGPNGEYKENVYIDKQIKLLCPKDKKGRRAVIDASNT